MRSKSGYAAGWLLLIPIATVPAAVAAKSTEVDAIKVSDLNLATLAGRQQLDQRLRDAVAATCRGRSPHATVQFQPAPGGRGSFIATSGQSSRDKCMRETSRKAHSRRDWLIEQSALDREVEGTR
jgi:UrcA family protein